MHSASGLRCFLNPGPQPFSSVTVESPTSAILIFLPARASGEAATALAAATDNTGAINKTIKRMTILRCKFFDSDVRGRQSPSSLRSTCAAEALLLQPGVAFDCPLVTILRIPLPAAQTDAVFALGVDVQCEQHAVASQCLGKLQRVLHIHRRVLNGVEEECRRRGFRDMPFVGEQFNQRRVWIVAKQICP